MATVAPTFVLAGLFLRKKWFDLKNYWRLATVFNRCAGVFVTFLAAGLSGCGGTSVTLNPVQIENARLGDSSWMISSPAKNHEIEGYASSVSVNRGQSIRFFISTIDPSYRLDVYRLGWYHGVGGRRVMPTLTLSGFRQPSPIPNPTTGLIECDWQAGYTLSIPSSPDPSIWPSGIYLAKLTGNQSNKQSYIVFVVRDDNRASSDLLFENAITTYQAYNDWGGMSLYTHPRAYKVSFNRPYSQHMGASNLFRWEYYMVRFLEQAGYDVTYTTDVDVHLRGDLLLSHKAILIVGHDEYWSWQMRDNFEAARDAGVNLGFFASNNAYWQIRFEASAMTGDANRTMVCYKQADRDPYASDGDPSHQHLVTVRFRDPLVNRPENQLVGVMYTSQTVGTNDIVITDPVSSLFANTGLSSGDRLHGLLGYEADRVYPGGPDNLEIIAQSPFVYNGEANYSNMTLYVARSGAVVVATGTMQWGWGLDSFSFNPHNLNFSNQAVRLLTTNILQRFLASQHLQNCSQGVASEEVLHRDPEDCR
jgi:hypothetical protein